MTSSSDAFEAVELLADEFMERQRRGERPSIDEYVQKHPELADEIRDVFPALAVIEQIAPASADLVQSQPDVESPAHVRISQIGDYRILREVGRGGMGVVYEAEQESLRRRVALKVLPRQFAGDQKALERFQREARAAARMHHTNIVPVFEVGSDDEHVFYAMQLIQGQGLDNVIEDLQRLRSEHSQLPAPARAEASQAHSIAASLVVGKFEQENLGGEPVGSDAASNGVPVENEQSDEYNATVLVDTAKYDTGSTASAVLPGQSEISTAETNRGVYFRSVAEIGHQTASALAYAHTRGIIHRDIKPSNLLLDTAGVVWITDFGLAKTGDEGLTHTGDILGTIRYMSPERFRGQCDVRADVYSLGLTLYELLVLTPAYSSPDRLKLIEMVTKSEPPTPRSIDPRIPLDLETIVLKSIDKDPRRRYQSADDLADDLERFIHDEPIQARRITVVERFSRWARRNKSLAVLLSTVATLLVVIAIGSMLMARHFLQLEQKATAAATENARQAEEMKDLAADKEEQREQAVAARQQVEQAQAELQRELYVSDMQRVRLAYEEGAADRMEELLGNYIPLEGEPDLRGWEWFYWWRVSHRNIEQRQFRNGTTLRAMVSSPDGSWVALRRWQDMILIIDPQTGEVVKEFIGGLWFHNNDLAVSPDGKVLAASSPDGIVQLWKTDDWSELATLQHERDQISLAFSSTGLLAAADREGRISFWNAENGTPADPPLETGQTLGNLVFSPDATQLLTSAFFNDRDSSGLLLWNLADRTSKIISRQNPGITSLAWNQFESRSVIVSGQWDGDVLLSDGETFEQFHRLSAGGPVKVITFSPDASRIAVGTTRTNTIKVMETATGRLLTTIKGHFRDVTGLCFVGGGERIWSSSEDSWLKIWDVSQSDAFQQLHASADLNLRILTFGADGRSLWLNKMIGPVQRWDVNTGAALPVFTPEGEDPRSVFSSDGDYLITMKRSPAGLLQMEVWRSESDPPSLVLRRDLPEDFSYPDRGTISNNGKVVASSIGPQVIVTKLDTDESLTYDGGFDPKTVANLALSPDGSMLLVPRFWTSSLLDISGDVPRNVTTIDGYGPIFNAVFSPDGQYLAVAHWNNDVTLYDASTGELLHQFRGHAGSAWGLAFSPDGTLLASGGFDGTVRVWNLDPEQRGLVLTFSAHDVDVRSVAFSRDSQTIASISDDGDTRLWKIATSAEIQQDSAYWSTRRLRHEDLSNWKAAYSDQTQLVQINPVIPDHYATRAHLALALDRIPAAMSDFQTAVTLGGIEYLDRLTRLASWKPIDNTVSLTANQWRYTLRTPDDHWRDPDYDDSDWKSGGNRLETTNSGPVWPEQQIWLRNEFMLDSQPSGPSSFLVYADDFVTISVNGQRAGEASWIGSKYQVIPSKVPFQPGRNVIAVHCRNVELRAGVHVIPVVRTRGENLFAILSAELNANPEDKSLLQQRAELYADFQHWDKAAADYLAILNLHSQEPGWNSSPEWNSESSIFLKIRAGNKELFEALRRQLPDASELWLARGRSLALQSDWSAAAEAFSQYPETPGSNSEIWFEIACAKYIVGDESGYRQWLNRLIDEVGDTPKPFSAFILARTASLSRQNATLTSRAVEWSDTSLASERNNWYLHAAGLAQYRGGNFDQARQLLTVSLESGWNKPLNRLGLALLSHGQGQAEEAQNYLTLARDWRDGQLENGLDEHTRDQVIDWIAFHALLRETESILIDSQPGDSE